MLAPTSVAPASRVLGGRTLWHTCRIALSSGLRTLGDPMARFVTAALAVLLTVPLTVRAETADGQQIEEIVVTGSMIRRDNFDLSSPVEVITDLDIEEAGTVSLGDVLVNMAAQSGVSTGETVPYSFGNLLTVPLTVRGGDCRRPGSSVGERYGTLAASCCGAGRPDRAS